MKALLQLTELLRFTVDTLLKLECIDSEVHELLLDIVNELKKKVLNIM